MTIPFLVVFTSALITSGLSFVINKLYINKKQQLNQQQQQHSDLQTRLNEIQAELNHVQQQANTENKTNQLAAQIISQLNHGVLYIDVNGQVQFVNKYAEKYIQDSNSIGKPYTDVLKNLKIDDQNNFSPFEQALQGKKQKLSFNIKLAVKEKNIPISATVKPLTGSSGIVFIFTDNSRNMDLIEEEKAFFSVAVHELRTPLTAISMASNLLVSKYNSLTPKKIKEKLNKIEQTSKHALELVNDFLNISRIAQGRLEINKETLDIVSLTEEVIKELSDLVQERKLYIKHNKIIDASNRKILGDKTKTKEVLINLISNAIKYTVQGGVTINHQETEGFIKTSITDTGAGIPPETARLLFKRFGQTHAGKLKSSKASTGLGLYISQKIAQLMDGDVNLEASKPNKGSTFTFSLPVD